MPWTRPEYSRTQVDKAGATLINPEGSVEDAHQARRIINNWRAAHSLPLNALQMNLRHNVAMYGDEALVAQRLKRLSSIEGKLQRLRRLRLSRVQDIGGCRAILPTAGDVHQVVQTFRESRAKHELLRESDYLTTPRESGYRGVHLIYGYQTGSARYAIYRGMQIEVQLRSRLQHAWATAVETVSIFSGQALKSSEGNEDWLELFALMGTALAFKEGLPPVPGTPTEHQSLRRALRSAEGEIGAIARLEAYSGMLSVLQTDRSKNNASYFHIFLESRGDYEAELIWREYSESEREEAIEAYEEVEEIISFHIPDAETVLVRVDSVDTLRRAYPNYFADTRIFVAELKKAIA